MAKLGTNFAMAHKMGLLTANITTSTTEVDNVITYDGNSWNETTWSSSTSTKLYYLPSRTFSSGSRTPYINSNTLYYIGKSSDTSITFTADLVETAAGTSTTPHSYYWQLNSSTSSSTTVGGAGSFKTLTIPAYSGKTFRTKIWNFTYSNSAKTWKAPHTGTYTMECWGAGFNAKSGCRGGGYCAGSLTTVSANDYLYVYVGSPLTNSTSYVFNGGGPSGTAGGATGATGCGATDFRTTGGGWNDIVSLRSRIIVAGGAAMSSSNRSNSSSAGGVYGYQGYHDLAGDNYDVYCGKGGGPTSGGAIPTNFGGAEYGTAGQFGYGGKGGASTQYQGSGGGGGGWYGGSGGNGAGSGGFGGGGGSSFISGHPGCNGINSSGTHQGTGKPSKVLFQGTGSEHTITFSASSILMIDGGGYQWTSASRGSLYPMPNPSGGNYPSGVGHSGAGYARITYVNP